MLKCGEKGHARRFANVLLSGVDKRFEQLLKTFTRALFIRKSRRQNKLCVNI